MVETAGISSSMVSACIEIGFIVEAAWAVGLGTANSRPMARLLTFFLCVVVLQLTKDIGGRHNRCNERKPIFE